METKLYVGNLNWEADESQVKELFESCGEVVSVKLISDRSTGRSRGFAFIEMGDQQQAEKAITDLNGNEFMGRKLIVNIARPKSNNRNFRNNRR
jgi:RNA recognition motif-containing protein